MYSATTYGRHYLRSQRLILSASSVQKFLTELAVNLEFDTVFEGRIACIKTTLSSHLDISSRKALAIDVTTIVRTRSTVSTIKLC